MLARVDGGYGMFNYKTGSKQQIWIGGHWSYPNLELDSGF